MATRPSEPPPRRRIALGAKRALDVFVATWGLLLGSPVLLAAWIAATIDTGRNGFFRQARIGKDGVPFELLKIRTMRPQPGATSHVTTGRDPRITPLGRWLRRAKIDELPQLFNVLLGDMSLVGPRPDVPGYADALQGDDRIILTVRPGITGPASLKYRDEEALLAAQDDPEAYNDQVLYPDKVHINRAYVERYSFREDLRILWRTLVPGRREPRSKSWGPNARAGAPGHDANNPDAPPYGNGRT